MRRQHLSLFIGVIILLASLLGSIGHIARANSPIFSDGFESGDFTAWTGTEANAPNTVAVISTTSHTGTYCMQGHGVGGNLYARAYKTLASTYTEVYMRVYFEFSDVTAENRIVELGDSIGTEVFVLTWQGANNRFVIGEKYPLNDYYYSTTLSDDTWYCIEVHFLKSVSGNYRVYLGGSQVYDHNVDTSLAPDVGRVYIGLYYAYSTSDECLDDVVVDSSYIGPGFLDNTPPTCGSTSTNTSIASAPCNFDCLISDDTNVSTYIFSSNNTGTWINDTALAFTSFYNSSAAWANVTKTLNDTVGNTVSYLWYANDTSNNWSISDQYNLTLTAPYRPTLQLTPTTQTCRKYGENFTINMTLSDPVNVTSLKFEIHYNATLLNCSSVTLTAWGSGTVTVDQINGVVNGSTSDAPLNDNRTLVLIQFTATYYHIWKNLPGWTNDINDTIFIQSANLTSSSQPDRTYIRGTTNQINVGPDVIYTFSPIKGDVNNDGKVDIEDLSTVASFYDQTSTTYNLVGDPQVDIYDLVVIASNFWFKY